jgi:putative hydrolase of the HAD superfamily
MADGVDEGHMNRAVPITTLFLDVGGVLLTNGWDHHVRKRAATAFKLEWAEMEDQHHLTLEAYEVGKLTLEEYLRRVVFCQKRPFSRAQFRRFMFALFGAGASLRRILNGVISAVAGRVVRPI